MPPHHQVPSASLTLLGPVNSRIQPSHTVPPPHQVPLRLKKTAKLLGPVNSRVQPSHTVPPPHQVPLASLSLKKTAKLLGPANSRVQPSHTVPPPHQVPSASLMQAEDKSITKVLQNKAFQSPAQSHSARFPQVFSGSLISTQLTSVRHTDNFLSSHRYLAL